MTALYLPEDAHRAKEHVLLANERKCGDSQMPPLAVRASGPHRLRNRAALGQRAHHRSMVRRKWIAIVIDSGDERGPLCGRQFARFVEAMIEDRLCRLVVVDEGTRRIDKEDRRRDGARELPRQDDLNGFGGRHRLYLSLRNSFLKGSEANKSDATPLLCGGQGAGETDQGWSHSFMIGAPRGRNLGSGGRPQWRVG